MGNQLSLLDGELANFHWQPASDMNYDTMQQALAVLANIEEGHQYWVGDAIRYAQEKFGESYAQLIPEGKESVWRQYLWVCERVSPEIRKLLPSFSHARAIASLSPEDQLAVIDSSAGNTTRELKTAVSALKPVQKQKKKPWPVALLTWGRIKQAIDAFEGIDDDTPIILNIGPDANEVTVYEGPGENTTLYGEGWHGDESAALCTVSRNEML